MGFAALHMNRTEPARPQYLGNALCVRLVSFIEHRGQGGAGLAGFHTNDVKA